MNLPAAWVVSCAAAAGLGSLPVGLWWGRLARGIDVREHGSRNLGATNVYRVLGPGHGVSVLLLDAAKGGGAVVLARSLVGPGAAPVAAGLLAVLGHMFSPWVGFRGGKGVATGLGVWICLAWLATCLSLVLWGIALAATRRVSVASLLAACALVPGVVLLGAPEGRTLRMAAAVLTALLIWIRHRGNLSRLARGQEPPLWGART